MEDIICSHKGTTGLEDDDTFNIPLDLLKIYSFSQLELPEDLNLPDHIWPKIMDYVNKYFPDFEQK